MMVHRTLRKSLPAEIQAKRFALAQDRHLVFSRTPRRPGGSMSFTNAVSLRAPVLLGGFLRFFCEPEPPVERVV